MTKHAKALCGWLSACRPPYYPAGTPLLQNSALLLHFQQFAATLHRCIAASLPCCSIAKLRASLSERSICLRSFSDQMPPNTSDHTVQNGFYHFGPIEPGEVGFF